MSEKNEIKIHDPSFKPHGPGRPPTADISKLTYAAAEHAGQWVSQVFTNKEAQSAINQLKRRGYEYSSVMVDADHREVFCRYPGRNPED